MKLWKDVFWFYTILFIILIIAIPFRGNVSLLGMFVFLYLQYKYALKSQELWETAVLA
jgi:hypothetical protein